MSERKNIDKLFQEKFKDFEVSPPENAWPELEQRLKKKKDRKVIPFWWKLSGVAAALMIGFLIGNRLGLFDDGNASKNEVVIQEKPNGNRDLNGNPNSQDATVQTENDSVQKTPVADASENSASEADKPNSSSNSDKRNSPEAEKRSPKFNGHKKANDAVVVKSKTPQNQKSEDTNARLPKEYNQSNSSNAIAKASESTSEKTTQKASGNNLKQINQKHNQKTNTNPETAVAGKSNEKLKSQPQDLQQPNQLLENPQNSIKATTTLESKSNTAIANRVTGEQPGSDKNTIDSTSSEAAAKDNLNKNIGSTTNPVAAVEEKNQEKKLDSTGIATVAPNALEELLNEKENKVAKEPKLNRWQITSNVAPIYFGSTSGGSPIDSTFANKSKDYNTQVGYGIGLSYAVNKRFTVRTGVNKVSLNYDTNDVQLYASMNEGGFQNLDSPAETEFLNFGRMVSASRANNASARAEATLADGEIATDKFTGSINQKMGYIEVPVEVSYAVINKKFGVNVIAGVSTLFLNENEVMLTSEGYKTNLGEANNLNTTHFSTNVGLGIKYSFFQSFEAKFEPIFKYQLNTFSKDNGDFKPYFFGLYTGLSFRF